ncbi:uncharacterized protein [Magallana gigas]|uniref:uncharacterized protein n=1 Tax=Magallana gigas TaxID=29159 RepID=UPI0033416BDD
MEHILQPPELDFSTKDGNLPERWRKWEQTMKLYLTIAMNGRTDAEKCSAFLYIIGQEEDEMLRDRIVCGVHSEKVKERLFRDNELTLNKALSICRANEESQSRMKDLQEEQISAVKCDKNRQSDAFEAIKDILSREPILTFFDVKKPVCVSVDASKCGLGAVITQDERPIAYASRSLTETEKRYAQIEKEMLAVTFGLERFHQYTYGVNVTVENDHEPLENILKKSLVQTPPRLQRLLLRLQKYDFNFKYVPGKQLIIADTLSRAHLPPTKQQKEEICEEMETHLGIEKTKARARTVVYWIGKLKNNRSKTVIIHMKSMFARHGIPYEVQSDNSPQYTSKEFKDFSRSWCFEHKTSSPYNPQGNGHAEKTVQTVKRMLEKTRIDGKDPYISLLEYRNTPTDVESPAKLLMSRQLRSILPITKNQLKPKVVPDDITRQKRKITQNCQKHYFDVRSRKLSSLSPGQRVRFRHRGQWQPRYVKDQVHTRSYNLQDQNGDQFRRNRRDIIQSKETSFKEPIVELNDEDGDTVREKETSNSEAGNPDTTEIEEARSPDIVQQVQPYKTRAGREVRRPQYLSEYV